MTILLGGAASPLGWTVQFVAAPQRAVLDELLRWRRSMWQKVRVARPRPFPDVLRDLAPMESPWTRELLMPCGRDWTAYLNNGVDGGDPSAAGELLARVLGVRSVVAVHTPPYGTGQAATQLWVSDPDAERTLDAFADDGRWTWDENGTPFAFEDVERYQRPAVRERLDRNLLLTYLAELGIPIAGDRTLGPGVVVRQKAACGRDIV